MDLGNFIVSLLFTAAYGAILIAWCANWYLHRLSHTRNIPLHKFIGLTLLFQFIVVVILVIFFGSSPSFAVAVVGTILSIIAEGIFFALLILIARGWCITIPDLPHSFKLMLAGYIAVYIVLEVFTLLLEGFLYVLDVIILFGMYIGLLFYIFSTTTTNIRLLGSEINSQSADAATTTATATVLSPYPSATPTYPPTTQPYPTTTTTTQQPYPPTQAYPPPTQPYYPPPYPPTQQPYPPAQPYPPPAPPAAAAAAAGQQPYPPTQPYPTYTPPQQPFSVQGYPVPPAATTTAYPLPSSSSPSSSPVVPHSPPPQAVFVTPANTDTNNNNSVPADKSNHVNNVDAAINNNGNTTTTNNTNNNGNTTEHIPEAQEKLRLFRIFYKLMVFYIVMILVFSILPGIFGSGEDVFSYLRMLLVLIFLSGICYVFRLRTLNHYFYLVLGEDV